MSSAAEVSKVTGAVFVIRGGQEIAVSQGMELLVSDSIRTGMNGQCELRFADATEVQLSPMSQVQIQDFAFNPDVPAENSFALHMMEGLVRTVSGEVVKLNPEGFALSTPLGTAGIRGTTVISQIFPTHVVFMVTDMGAGNSVVVSSVFGGDLTILMPGQGAELSLTEQQRITLIDSMPENMRDAVSDFFDNKYDDIRSSHDNSILLFGDLEFLSALGAENVGRGVGMLSADSEEILIELLQELGVEQPEFFLEAPPPGPDAVSPEYASFWGDATNNYLVPNSSLFGPDFKSVNYEIRGYSGNDTIVAFDGTDIVYGGDGSQDIIYKISDTIGSGNLIVGGEHSISPVSALDNDTIVLRSLGQSTDDEQGWTSSDTIDYGATLMSGGSVVGSAVELTGGTGGGDNSIFIYGSMTGGAIYGSAVNAVNSTLGNCGIKVLGLLDGGEIYGDANSMVGGQAGGDDIYVEDMKSGTIYGDAATGSYTPGSNSIFVNNTMSGGTIYTGNGTNVVNVGTMEDGSIIGGSGDDIVMINTYKGGVISLGQAGGSGQELHITSQEADLSLGGEINSTAITIGKSNGYALSLGALTGTTSITNSEGAADITVKSMANTAKITLSDPGAGACNTVMVTEGMSASGDKGIIGSSGSDSIVLGGGMGSSSFIDCSQGGADYIRIGVDTAGRSVNSGANVKLGDPGSDSNTLILDGSMGGSGAKITGSAGNDYIEVKKGIASEGTSIVANGGVDTIIIGSDTSSICGSKLKVSFAGGTAPPEGEHNVLRLIGGSTHGMSITGSDGAESVTLEGYLGGNGGDSTISLGGGNDTLEAPLFLSETSWNLNVDMGAGNDSMVIGQWLKDTLNLGEGADYINIRGLGRYGNGSQEMAKNYALNLGSKGVAADGDVDVVDFSNFVENATVDNFYAFFFVGSEDQINFGGLAATKMTDGVYEIANNGFKSTLYFYSDNGNTLTDIGLP